MEAPGTFFKIQKTILFEMVFNDTASSNKNPRKIPMKSIKTNFNPNTYFTAILTIEIDAFPHSLIINSSIVFPFFFVSECRMREMDHFRLDY
jgi:hypothetical protein